MSETLKPCPFCGSADCSAPGINFVVCQDCGAFGPDGDTGGAKWNAAPRPVNLETPPGLWAIYRAAAHWAATNNERPLRAALAEFEGKPMLQPEQCADPVTARFIESADAQEVAP